jgi:hypothetical protein
MRCANPVCGNKVVDGEIRQEFRSPRYTTREGDWESFNFCESCAYAILFATGQVGKK